MPDLWHTYINALQHLAIKKKQAAGHGACRDCLLDVSARSSRQRASDTILPTNDEQCDICSICHVN
jgi:hypothetical protein